MTPRRSGATRRRSATCSRSRRRTSTRFRAICERERCPFAVVARRPPTTRLVVADPHFGNTPVDMDLDVLLGKPPRMTRDVGPRRGARCRRSTSPASTVRDAAYRVLRCRPSPTRRSSSTIGDRTVGGLCARDQMVGPWQVPVADVAVTLMGFDGYAGEAMAIGERTPLALIDAPASGRMAVGEAITNIAAAGSRSCRRREALGQLDGAGGTSGRGRRALRHGARRRHGAVPRARHQHSGRQGFDVDAHDVARAAATTRRSPRRCR